MTTQSLTLCLVVGASVSLAALLAMSADSPAAEPAPVAIEVSGEQIDFRHGKALSARYHFGPKVAKPYFWPVNSPDGTTLTRGWPMEKAPPGEATDHPHQKSLWFCHGDIIPEGLDLKHKIKGVTGVDFWSEAVGHGRIVCTKVGEPAINGSQGQVATLNEWRTADDVKILDETRTLRFHNFGPAQLLIFDIDLHASVAPLTFGDTKEGSLGVRVRQELTEAKGKGSISNADGRVGEAGAKGCWGQVSAWCDYSGPIGDKQAGITVFTHPDNSLPSCWHSRGYGLMAANPFGRAGSGFPAMKGNKDLVKLAKGDHLKLRYGILLHQGDAKAGKVADYYQQFTKLKS